MALKLTKMSLTEFSVAPGNLQMTPQIKNDRRIRLRILLHSQFDSINLLLNQEQKFFHLQIIRVNYFDKIGQKQKCSSNR